MSFDLKIYWSLQLNDLEEFETDIGQYLPMCGCLNRIRTNIVQPPIRHLHHWIQDI